ncbi:hypothetical protein FQR65_LT17778 [Abscondita terminalis]|nr:hypothetical protein FQR65_LT17778 [Abscondita terminalis]
MKSGIEYMTYLADWYKANSSGKGVGFFQIGGGIAGDFPICVVPMMYQDLEMHDVPFWSYFCQISDSTTSYGSYSGAVPNEKITWDYILSNVIENLKQLKEYNSAMLYVSDHGESLGEKNLYMHGMPLGIAPKEQYEIPFIVWLSNNSQKQLKPYKILSQNHVFHSVLNFMGVESLVYDENMNIFK